MKKYLEDLYNSHQSEFGLHLMSVCATSIKKGHVFAWTRVEDGYLLFDANEGEKYFKKFDRLIENICNTHIINIHIQSEISIVTKDCYDENDVKALQIIQPAIRLKKELSSNVKATYPHNIKNTP